MLLIEEGRALALVILPLLLVRCDRREAQLRVRYHRLDGELLHLLLQLRYLLCVRLGRVRREHLAPILRPRPRDVQFALHALLPIEGVGDEVVLRLVALVSRGRHGCA